MGVEKREMRKGALILVVVVLGTVLLISPVLQGSSSDIETRLNQLEERIEALEGTVGLMLESLVFLSKESYNTELPKTERVTEEEEEAGELEAQIKAYAKRKWPDDYEMQLYEYDKQLEAFQEFRNLPSTPDYNQDILVQAMVKWEYQWDMVIYEYDKQLEAYKKMQR